MKKLFLVIFITIFLVNLIFSKVNFDFTFSPSIIIKNYEIDEVPDGNDILGWEMYDYLPPFFEIKYSASFSENDLFFISVPIIPDASIFYLESNSSNNLPLSKNYSFQPDSNIPYEAFFEFSNGFYDFSMGRRRLKWGEGMYSLGINDRVPNMDHIMFSLDWDTKLGDFGYEYILASPHPKAANRKKTFVTRKLSLDLFSSLLLEVGEIALIYTPDLTFVDINPFLVYHNIYESDSNVVGYLSSTFKIQDYTLYSEFLLDQYQLSTEPSDSDPNAYGFMIGGKKKVNELILGTEFYKTSTWLYNKNENYKDLTYPLWRNLEAPMGSVTIDYFLGFPCGPDSELTRFFIEGKKFGISYEHLLQGEVDINTPYTKENFKKYSEKGPVGETKVENIWRGHLKLGNNPTFLCQALLRNKDLWLFLGFEYDFSLLIP
ncbi:hypothetical protein PW5551_02500 [Petrotoga sp. 9PW.55.5.1]|nr:hypothetical protein PW5551_02500 [Petrotoga sp. 9PW.55.5.1]